MDKMHQKIVEEKEWAVGG